MRHYARAGLAIASVYHGRDGEHFLVEITNAYRYLHRRRLIGRLHCGIRCDGANR